MPFEGMGKGPPMAKAKGLFEGQRVLLESEGEGHYSNTKDEGQRFF
jgi:hypothetical protein